MPDPGGRCYLEAMADPSASYAEFLREAIRTYWRTRRGRRVRFLALLLASREAWGVALEEAASVDSAKKVLTGAASATAVAVLLRVLLGGPLGVLLTGASIAGLVTVYGRNHRDVMVQSERCRRLVDAYRGRWKEIVDEHARGSLRSDQRDLMLDGLLRRFLDDLDADARPAADAGDDDADDGGRAGAKGGSGLAQRSRTATRRFGGGQDGGSPRQRLGDTAAPGSDPTPGRRGAGASSSFADHVAATRRRSDRDA